MTPRERNERCSGCCACEPGDWLHVPLCDGTGRLLARGSNEESRNPFDVLDAGGTFDDFVAAVGEIVEEQIFNYVGSEADFYRIRRALEILIDRESRGWDQAAEENADARGQEQRDE